MPDLRRDELAQMAGGAGLAVVGVTTAEPFHELAAFLTDHIQRGHVTGMNWFTTERAVESCDPRILHQQVRSIISVAVPYWSAAVQPPDDDILRGRIARYAWGCDYHRVLKSRMLALVDTIERSLGRKLVARTLVDTARIVDRAVAARAGVGWYGKNSMILVPGYGSWVMLGEILLDLELAADLPMARNCGRCTRCIDRCPTGAIVEPYRIDAPRCISYLTIEERGVIPLEIRSSMGAWVFGCDVCQDVCPYTAAAHDIDDEEIRPRTIDNAFPSLRFLAEMTETQFRDVFRGTAVLRAKRAGLARNAAIALGNSGRAQAEPVLRAMVTSHDVEFVRGHAAWALATLDPGGARNVLTRARAAEPSEYVRAEIDAALAA